jgi:hypothetical protein
MHPHINYIDIKWRYFSFVKIIVEHTLMATLTCPCHTGAERQTVMEMTRRIALFIDGVNLRQTAESLGFEID